MRSYYSAKCGMLIAVQFSGESPPVARARPPYPPARTPVPGTFLLTRARRSDRDASALAKLRHHHVEALVKNRVGGRRELGTSPRRLKDRVVGADAALIESQGLPGPGRGRQAPCVKLREAA